MPESALQLSQALFARPDVFKVVAELDGMIIGSNYLWEYDAVRAVGPITVDTSVQSKGAGRKLMEAVIERGKGRDGIRLVKDAFTSKAMSLYASLGFDVREPLALIEGDATGDLPSGVEVRVAVERDFAACTEVCRKV